MSDALGFKYLVLQHFFNDMQRSELDNYSAERYSYDGVDRSGVFDIPKHTIYLDWFINNYEAVYKTYQAWADERSRELYLNLLRYRLAGHLHVRIDAGVQRLVDKKREFEAAFSGTPSSLRSAGMFGGLWHYDQVWEGARFTVDTVENGMVSALIYRQYFFERDGVVIAPAPGDHMIEGGAFTGEKSIVFSRCVGPQGRVYSFDPVADHLEICRHNLASAEFANVALFGYGLSDRALEAPPISLGTYSPGFRVFDTPAPLCRIDDLVMQKKIERIDFIAMDVEGSEVPALRGALSSLHAFRPKLAISLYHKPDDFFEVCEFLKALDLGYVFYLDHYAPYDEETVLYAHVP